MSTMESLLRLSFSALASFLAVLLGVAYNAIHYHNAIEHNHVSLPVMSEYVMAIGPWLFVIPLTVLVLGLVLRRHPLAVLVLVNSGWLTAVVWPPLYLCAGDCFNIVL